MSIRRAVVTVLAGGLSACAIVATTGAPRTAADQAAATPIYQDPTYSSASVPPTSSARMSVAEKASQTISSVAPAIPRLGIAQYGWWNEALHGVSRLQYNHDRNATTLINTTSYPIDQSLGASWDPALIYKVATAISDEAREVVPNNVLNLDFYSPTMNLERDPRWGRNDEAYGEDPCRSRSSSTSSSTAWRATTPTGSCSPPAPATEGAHDDQALRAQQQRGQPPDRHLEHGRPDASASTTRRRSAASSQDAQPASVMSSYNSVNDVPAAADPYLIDTLMRQTFGFSGYMTSDCDAIFEIVPAIAVSRRTGRGPSTTPSATRSRCRPARTPTARSASTTRSATSTPSLPRSAEAIRTPLDTFNVNDLDTTVHAPVPGADEDRRVRRRGAVEPWVQQARARVPAGLVDERGRQQRRHRDASRGSTSRARRPTRRSCC